MKKLLLFIITFLPCFSIIINAKTDDDAVVLVVSGDGYTKNEAINNALRNALEQTYGAFVSSNTTILNDELVRDEIVTLSSGTVKNYKEISSIRREDGVHFVTIEATISLSGLTQYAKSKGSSAELAGSLFARNMKLREINTANEREVLTTLINQVVYLAKDMYDKEITIGEPKYKDEFHYVIPIQVDFKPNNNTNTVLKLIYDTFASISLSEDEVLSYEQNNLPYYYAFFGERRYSAWPYITDDNIGELASDVQQFLFYSYKGRLDIVSLRRNKATNSCILLKNVVITERTYKGDYNQGMIFYTRNELDRYIHLFFKYFINSATAVKIQDNMGNIILDSSDRYNKQYHVYYPNLLSIVPVHFDFVVKKEDIGKYSSFTVIP